MLTVIVGLPGSGKTQYAIASAIRNPGGSIYDDFLGGYSREDDGGRKLRALGAAVRDRQIVYACESLLCLEQHRGAFLRFLALQGASGDAMRWVCFVNSPAACLSNVGRRYRHEAVNNRIGHEAAESRRQLSVALIEAMHPVYEIPLGAEVLPVFDFGASSTPS